MLGHCAFYPKVEEEIFVVNSNSKTVLNYITLMQCPDTSVINMLAGPTAMNFKGQENDFDEEGYRSQEIFTMEKYFFIYYKGLLLLEHFYKHGIAHGQINASTLKISEDYSFALMDFAISNFHPDFSALEEQDQFQK